MVEVRLYRAVFMHFPNGARTSGFSPKGEILSRRRLIQGSPMFSACSCTSHDFRHPFPPVSALNIGFHNIFHIRFPQVYDPSESRASRPQWTCQKCSKSSWVGGRDKQSHEGNAQALGRRADGAANGSPQGLLYSYYMTYHK